MAKLVDGPAVIEAAGNKPKRIEEYFGRVRSGTPGVSIARMQSPPGWQEPGQTPEFDEYALVLSGALRVEHEGRRPPGARRPGRARARGRVGALRHAGARGRRVRGRVPARLSPATVHRDE